MAFQCRNGVKKMILTKRIEQFIKETAVLATTEDPELTMKECIAEYTSQVLEDDYYNVVNWANWKGIKIPMKLRNVIDPTF